MGDARGQLIRMHSRTETEAGFGANAHKHTIYYMNIEVGNSKYYLAKRYTEFAMLHQKLRDAQYPEVEDFDFPLKVWFTTFSEATIEYRRHRFESYVQLLLTLAPKYPGLRKELDNFLGVPQTIEKGPGKVYPKTPKALLRKGLPENYYNRNAGLDESLGASNSKRAFLNSSLTKPLGHGGNMVVSAAGGPASPSDSDPRLAKRRTNAVTLLVAYLVLVILFALGSAIDPTKARAGTLSILALSCGVFFYAARSRILWV